MTTLKKKGRFRVEPVAKTRILPQEVAGFLFYVIEKARFGKNDRIFRHAQLLGDPSRRNAVDSESLERLPNLRVKVGLHDHQEALDDMLVMVAVSHVSEVVVRVGQPFEKPVGRVETDGGHAVTLPAVVAGLVHRHLVGATPGTTLHAAGRIGAGGFA